MAISELHDAYGLVLWEMRVLAWLPAVVLVLAAAAFTKYLFFR